MEETDKKKLTFEDYDAVSVHYDEARRPVGLASFKSHLRASPFKDNHKILDLGCGTGNYLQHLHSEAVEYTGLEQSEGMAAKCNAKIEKLGITNAKAVAGSAFEIPFPDNSFTAVITTQTLHHFGTKDKVKAVFKEVGRVLQEGGVFIINHCDYRQGFICWWTRFLPSYHHFAAETLLSSEEYSEIASDWFDYVQTDVIEETLTRQDLFENPKYIISKEGRLTDSGWRSVPTVEMDNACLMITNMINNKTWENWFEGVQKDLQTHGQCNNLVLKKK